MCVGMIATPVRDDSHSPDPCRRPPETTPGSPRDVTTALLSAIEHRLASVERRAVGLGR